MKQGLAAAAAAATTTAVASGSVLFLLLLLRLGTPVIGAPTCPSNEFTGDGRCCQECGPGWGMAERCRGRNNTQCEPCHDSLTFSSSWSHTERCLPCRVCPGGTRVRSPCTEADDTVCECDDGLYARDTDGACVPCRLCPPGTGVVSQCSPDGDATCELCPPGFYSEWSSNAEPCMPCASCSDDQVELKECTPSADTICFDKNPGIPDLLPKGRGTMSPRGPEPDELDLPEWDVDGGGGGGAGTAWAAGPPPGPRVRETEREEEGGLFGVANSTHGTPASSQEPLGGQSRDIIPVYCSIMAAVVVGLVAYVIFKRWHSCKNVQGSKARGEYSAAADGEKQHQDSGVFVDTHGAQPPPASGGGGGGDGGGGGGERGRAGEAGKWSYAALPACTRDEVEELLSADEEGGGGGWRELAAALGYDADETEALAGEERPARALLAAWAALPGSTQDTLVDALGRLQRGDVIARLRQETTAMSVV
ncbi:tumor necrosis factor receptor superfamily member 16-like [Lampetra fluviatilis]